VTGYEVLAIYGVAVFSLWGACRFIDLLMCCCAVEMEQRCPRFRR
jgi:hypothetical protein